MIWNEFQRKLAKHRRRLKKITQVFEDVAYRPNRDLKKAQALGAKLKKADSGMRNFVRKNRLEYWPQLLRDKVLLNAFATYDVADIRGRK